MRVLAFDQSTTISGYAVLDDGVLKSSGVVDKRSTKDLAIRFKTMGELLAGLIDIWNPDIVIMEDTVLQKDPSCLKLLSRLQGIIIGNCFKNEIPFEITSPSSWRAVLGFIQGKGAKRNRLKEQAITYVQTHFDKVVKNDEADAICIGASYFVQQKERADDTADE